MWESLQPWLIGAGISLAASFVPWACNEVRSSEWYKTRPWWQKKLIDFAGVYLLGKVIPSSVLRKDIKIALEAPVDKLMPKANELRDSIDRKISEYDAEMLTKAAVQDAVTEMLRKDPCITKKLTTWELEQRIRKEVPKVVDTRKNRPDFKKPGTKGGRR